MSEQKKTTVKKVKKVKPSVDKYTNATITNVFTSKGRLTPSETVELLTTEGDANKHLTKCK